MYFPLDSTTLNVVFTLLSPYGSNSHISAGREFSGVAYVLMSVIVTVWVASSY